MKTILLQLITLFVVMNTLTFHLCAQTSPTVSSLGKFSSNPVGLYTGTPAVSIPLWIVSGKTISLPIGLSYHSGGIRVSEIAPSTGLGWAMSSGGVITQTIRGKADDSPQGFLNTGALPSAASINDMTDDDDREALLEEYANGTKDSQPDIFYYNFAGRSGKFVFTKNLDGNNEPIVYTIPDSKLKIQISYNNPITYFTITTENGVIYEFKEIETLDYTNEVSNQNVGQGTNKSWYLTKIISPVANEYISLEYEAYSLDYYIKGSETKAIAKLENWIDFGLLYHSAPMIHYSSNGSSKRIKEIKLYKDNKMLEQVSFQQGIIERCDLKGDYPLEEIAILNLKGETVKKIKFDYSYFTPSGKMPFTAQCWNDDTDKAGNDLEKRLCLDKITNYVGDDASEALTPHTFQYNEPYLPSRFSYFQDHWGFYNKMPDSFYEGNAAATYETNTLIPRQELDNPQYPGDGELPTLVMEGAYREPNLATAKAASLRKVIYPSGASVTYEHNLFSQTDENTGLSAVLGGLNVLRTVSHDGFNIHNDLITEYEYYLEDDVFTLDDIKKYIPAYGYWEYNGGECNENLGVKCDYKKYVSSSHTTEPLNYTPFAVGFTKVKVRKTQNGQSLGETVYEYGSQPLYPTETNNSGFNPLAPINKESWKDGTPLTITSYKEDGSGNLIKIKEVENHFQFFGCTQGDIQEGCFAVPGLHIATKDYSKQQSLLTEYGTQYYAVDFNTNTGRRSLNYSKVTSFNDDGSTLSSQMTTYFYNDNFMIEKSTQVIEGEIFEQLYTYPVAGNSAVEDLMISKNMIATRLSNQTLKDGNTTSKSQTNFEILGGKILATSTSYSPTGSEADLKVDQLYSYDTQSNNLLEVTVPEAGSSTTIWGFESSLPIAQVANAQNSEVAYHGFEFNHDGNWSFDHTKLAFKPGLTGMNAGSAATGQSLPLSKTLTSTKKYILSYWAKGTLPTVTYHGTNKTPIASDDVTTNGWTYYELVFDGTAGNTIALTLSDQAQIDELRLHPEDALMSSTAYKPGIGVLASCSANNIISYYEYDEKNRLVRIKDYEGNILNAYEYSEKLAIDFEVIPFDVDGQNGVSTKEVKLSAISNTNGIAASQLAIQWIIDGVPHPTSAQSLPFSFSQNGRHTVALKASYGAYTTTTVEKTIDITTPLKAEIGVQSGTYGYECESGNFANFTLGIQVPHSFLKSGDYSYSWKYHRGSTDLVTIGSNQPTLDHTDLQTHTNLNNYPYFINRMVYCEITDIYGNMLRTADFHIPLIEENTQGYVASLGLINTDGSPSDGTVGSCNLGINATLNNFNADFTGTIEWYKYTYQPNGGFTSLPLTHLNGQTEVFVPSDVVEISNVKLICKYKNYCQEVILTTPDVTVIDEGECQ